MRPNAEKPTHDGLIRIQNEISEVEKRENELKKEHASVLPSSRTNSLNGDVSETSSSPEPSSTPPVVTIDSKDHFKKNKIIEPQPKPQYLPVPGLTRALTSPQLFQVSPMKKFNLNNTPHRGIMEKFIASRGKLIGNQPAQNNFKKNLMMSPIEFNSGGIKAFSIVEKPTIERDIKGRPVRKGYIPVEEKIQSELRDLKNRECELKKLHKLNGIRDSDDDFNSSDDLDSDWSPLNGKLSKSIDALNSNSSLSPSPETQRPVPQPRTGVIRPAVSLAQLCDLDESETPSSHKLIERWESIIQENLQREKSHNLH
ncbi:CLUMA_CG001846, isoform A [Clunio marinus]|uniref:CLUMA_CG001846, isoform A n=1 Tax=Clunio marinus TaxID=568069 RepID=A0A1J1HJ68_9DIPT|nr:CLUMA_CG001846, isoform A [Clunio marinus]